MYTVVLRQLRWTENVERDVFLAPVSFSANVVMEIVMKVLNLMRVVILAIAAEALERVVHVLDVHVRAE
jgi:hypothetical protein